MSRVITNYWNYRITDQQLFKEEGLKANLNPNPNLNPGG